jgi:cyanophycin synthetase
MRVLERNVYVGPSHHAHFPVIRLALDLGALEAWPTGRLGPAFTGPLLDALPTLRDHGCSYGVAGGFVRRLTEDEGTWMGHVLEHAAIELQNVAGAQVTFGKTRSVAGRPGVYDVVFEYEQRDVGLAAAELARDLLAALAAPLLPPAERAPELAAAAAAFDWGARRDAFIRYAQRRALGPSTAAIVHAAERRGIPWLRLNERSLIQLGYGRHQQRIQATITGRTPHIAVEIAGDKEETNRLLADLGLPVPRQALVRSPDEAADAAAAVGYPVVVKPYNGNHGRGVSIGLAAPDDVRRAFAAAAEHADAVLVESFIAGHDHRMLVVDGALVAVSKRVPGHVVGDGRRTVAELVDAVNADPRRGIGHEKVLTQIRVDEQALSCLAALGYTPDSVPAAGEEVMLRRTANLSTGGTAADVTDVVHPDNAEMAVRAVQAVGLDVGGVDFLTPDVTRSYQEIGGAICEVNAAPGFRMHMAPSEGRARDVAARVIDMLFPPGAPATIPIAAVTGTNGKTTTARMLAHIHKMAGRRVGLTTTDGVYVDGQRTVEGDMTGPTAARMVLSDPAVDVAVLETARGGLLRAGMAARRVDVGAVLNVQADHLGQRGVETLEQLALVKRTVVEVATDTAVLNADDPLTARMAAHTRAAHVCYVTMDPASRLVAEHVRAGGRAVALETGVNGQMITIYDRGAHIPLVWTHLVPAALGGRAAFNVQNAMFAAAMAFSMGVRLEDVRHGLRTFTSTFYQAPGRLNVYEGHPFTVLFDYAHNADAVAALVATAGRLDVAGRRVMVLSAPGDRRDDDVRATARAAAAGGFDRYVCRRDDNPRGRGDDEVPRLLAATLVDAGVPAERVEVVVREVDAIDRALGLAGPGDLVVICADALERGWEQIEAFGAAGRRAAEASPAGGGGASSAGAEAHAVPRDPAPADDPAPPAPAALPAVSVPAPDGADPAGGAVPPGMLREARGVILAPEASD